MESFTIADQRMLQVEDYTVEINRFEVIDSTHIYATKNIPKYLKDNYIVAYKADEQVKGIGSTGRKWISPKGNIYLTLQYFNKNQTNQQIDTKLMALAAYETLSEYLDPNKLCIKWVNDILFNNKKLSGILCEKIIKGKQIVSINSIGMNINSDITNQNVKTTCLNKETNSKLDLEEILDKFFVALVKWIKINEQNDIQQIRKQYQDCLGLINQEVEVYTKTREYLYNGIFLGINDEFQAIVKNKQGEQILINKSIMPLDYFTKTEVKETKKSQSKAQLSQKDAENRSNSLKTDIKYRLFIDLQKGDCFQGFCEIKFHVINKDSIFLDFSGQQIISINLNSVLYDKEQIDQMWKDHKIHLPGTDLKLGLNNIVLVFKNKYYNDGNGLHSFIDSDGQQFIYSQSEPYWTNRVYPLFDQPDLKGQMQFNFLCPEDWKVLTNENFKIKCQSKNLKYLKNDLFLDNLDIIYTEKDFYQFEQTPLLSTYLFAFVAGPFIQFDDSNKSNFVPMSIYCRKSMKDNIQNQLEYIFAYAREGIKFFNKFFNYDYPFSKFDFVFCPEFCVGAMEYPGLVTFAEDYVQNNSLSRVEITYLGQVIIHELAHMWFGNLVTMKWWNDLWLNESFAEFTSFLCNQYIHKKLKFPTIDSWTFFLLSKNWGYDEDQMITTHPIAGKVENTLEADTIFDGITYSKGASVLKQLYYLIGHKRFSQNMGIYFNRYQWDNATLDDFIDVMDRNFDFENFSCQDWKQSWLCQAGLNSIELKWSFNDDKIKIIQKSCSEKFLFQRYHKVKFAFYDSDCNVIDVQDVLIKNKFETVIRHDNEKVMAVLPNYEDWGFFKICFDEISLKFFCENIGKIDNGLSQLLIIRSLYDRVADGLMKGSEFSDIVIETFLKKEVLENIQIFSSLMNFLQQVVFKYLPVKLKFQHTERICQNLIKMFQQIPDEEKEKKLTVAKKIVSFALNKKEISFLIDLFKQYFQNQDFSIGKNVLWDIVYYSHVYPDFKSQSEEIYEMMKKYDDSELKEQSEILIKTFTSDLKARKIIWNKILTDESISYIIRSNYLAGLFSIFCSNDLKQEFLDDFFNNQIVNVLKNKNKNDAKNFLIYCNNINDDVQYYIDTYTRIINELTDNEHLHKIFLKQKVDYLQKKQKALELYKTSDNEQLN